MHPECVSCDHLWSDLTFTLYLHIILISARISSLSLQISLMSKCQFKRETDRGRSQEGLSEWMHCTQLDVAQGTFAFTQWKKIIGIYIKPPPNGVWETRSQDALRTQKELSADHFWSDHPRQMLIPRICFLSSVWKGRICICSLVTWPCSSQVYTQANNTKLNFWQPTFPEWTVCKMQLNC